MPKNILTASKTETSRRFLTGFTLIEVLIYMAIIALIIGSLIGTVYQIFAVHSRLKEKFELQEEIHFALRKFEWALSGLDTINQPAAGATSTTLSVNKANFVQNPLVFNLSEGELTLQRNGSAAVSLLSSRVAVSSLLFEHIAASSTKPAGLRLQLELAFKPPTGVATSTTSSIETIIYARK